jgi:hypothetical protein
MYSAKCDITMEIGNFEDGVFVPMASHSYVGGVDNISKFEAHKGAITNAMKKCASMFGIASDIYKGISDPDLIENGGQVYEEVVETYTDKAVPTVQTEEDEPLPITERGDIFSQLLTELNSVKDKDTYMKAKDMMDSVSSDLEPEQLEMAVKALVDLAKKYGK